MSKFSKEGRQKRIQTIHQNLMARGDDMDCTAGSPLSEFQRKLDASVTPEQARIDVRREREALANQDKPHPQPDGFINDYD